MNPDPKTPPVPEPPAERRPMSQAGFEIHLNLLCQSALEGGSVSFGEVVAGLEFAKAQTIDLAKEEARREAEAQRPRILMPGGAPP